jgi:hypothetical protein
MNRIGETWHLQRGDEVLGDITVTGTDFPWLTGDFAARPGFAEVAPLFATVAEGSDPAACERAYRQIEATLTLVSPSGPAAEFLLNIDGDEAWFRWSDKPFSGSRKLS